MSESSSEEFYWTWERGRKVKKPGRRPIWVRLPGQPQLQVDGMSLEDLEEVWMTLEHEREMMVELGRTTRPGEIVKLRLLRASQKKIVKLMEERKRFA